MSEPTSHLGSSKGDDRWVAPRVRVFQSQLDGMLALINWLEGWHMARSDNKRIPGSFEFTIFYRELVRSSNELIEKDEHS